MGPTKSHLTSGIKCGATVFNTIVSVMAAPTVTYLRCHEQRHTKLRVIDTTTTTAVNQPLVLTTWV